jgi:beta-galactosidase
MSKGTIEIKGRDILINGVPTQIRSGAMHYFRIHPDYWRDRLVKLRQCGLNTVETYMCWNLHEKQEGKFDFSNWLDVVKFVKIAQEEGLMVMIRPGGYICSEWELGGLPSWLLVKPGIYFRCMSEPFIKAQDAFYRKACEILKPLQFTEGGPIIMFQVENEYGSYGDDHEYIAHCKQVFLDSGITVPLFHSEGASIRCLNAGGDPDLLPTVNGRNHPRKLVESLEKYRPNTPPFIMELWNGIGLRWDVIHRDHLAEEVRQDIQETMEDKINFNLYMFHGGTNFGFMNGGNGANEFFDRAYRPMMTSYDGNTPLNEAGQATEKYFAIQAEIAKFDKSVKLEKPADVKIKAFGKIKFTECVSFMDSLDKLSQAKKEVFPKTMEYYGQPFGFINYRFHVDEPGTYWLHDLKDRAIIMINGHLSEVIYRNEVKHKFDVPVGNCQLDILVENMGRINTRYEVNKEFKGITALTWGKRVMFNCEVYNLPLDNLEKLEFVPIKEQIVGPGFYRGNMVVDEPCDTFFKVPDGFKGVIWINGFNLGRYWNIGPQKNLYVPAPLMKKGDNEIILLELHHLSKPEIESVAKQDFGPVPPMLLP